MTAVQVTGLTGTAQSLDSETLERFAVDLDGVLARQGDDEYAEA